MVLFCSLIILQNQGAIYTMTEIITVLWSDMTDINELLQYGLIYASMTALVLGILKRVTN